MDSERDARIGVSFIHALIVPATDHLPPSEGSTPTNATFRSGVTLETMKHHLEKEAYIAAILKEHRPVAMCAFRLFEGKPLPEVAGLLEWMADVLKAGGGGILNVRRVFENGHTKLEVQAQEVTMLAIREIEIDYVLGGVRPA